jgi:hypothetical protein
MAIPFEQTEGFKLYLEIPPVELRVTTSLTSAGKVERYNSAGRLMHRLDEIGRRKLIILSLTEGGQVMPAQHVEAMNLYLHNNHGMRSFKRVCQTRFANKFGWAEFRERLNIPTLAILVNV